MTPLTFRNHLKTVLLKALITEIRFTSTYNIQLIIVSTSTSDIFLKSRQQLEAAIRNFLPSATSLHEEVQLTHLVIHKVDTAINGPLQILTGIESFNPDMNVHRAHRWLTKLEQWVGKQAYSILRGVIGDGGNKGDCFP